MLHPNFLELGKLCSERKLTLFTTEITRREIHAGIRVKAERAVQAIKDAARLLHTLDAPELSAVRTLATTIDAGIIADVWAKAVEAFFKKSRAIQLPLANGSLDTILKQYFNREPPFGGKNKKSEFPDAIVLQMLQASANGESVYAVSRDSDFEEACKHTDNLIYIQSLPELLNRVNENDAAARLAKEVVDKNLKIFEAELSQALKSLEPRISDGQGSVELHSIELDDIIDVLFISCFEHVATMDFICSAAIDAVLDYDLGDGLPEFAHVKTLRQVGITLVFSFNPTNLGVCEIKERWVPSYLDLSSHDA